MASGCRILHCSHIVEFANTDVGQVTGYQEEEQ